MPRTGAANFSDLTESWFTKANPGHLEAREANPRRSPEKVYAVPLAANKRHLRAGEVNRNVGYELQQVPEGWARPVQLEFAPTAA